MTQILYVAKGLPGSGKSFWAKKLADDNKGQVTICDKDSLRRLLHNGYWSKTNEKQVEAVRDAIVHDAINRGHRYIVVHDTNLAGNHLERMEEIAAQARKRGRDVQVKIKDFTDVPLETCIQRDLNRQYSVGKDVIMRMYNQYLKPAPPKREMNPNLDIAWGFDLDGTLALFDEKGHRGPYDTAKCEDDEVCEAVMDALLAHRNMGDKIIITSGREDTFRPQTVNWLNNHKIPYDALFMRRAGDKRSDAEVKSEIYRDQIAPLYNLAAMYDDRSRVVQSWRQLGIPCFQVAEGDF